MAIAVPLAPLIPKAAKRIELVDDGLWHDAFTNAPFAYKIEWPIGLALWNDKTVARMSSIYTA